MKLFIAVFCLMSALSCAECYKAPLRGRAQACGNSKLVFNGSGDTGAQTTGLFDWKDGKFEVVQSHGYGAYCSYDGSLISTVVENAAKCEIRIQKGRSLWKSFVISKANDFCPQSGLDPSGKYIVAVSKISPPYDLEQLTTIDLTTNRRHKIAPPFPFFRYFVRNGVIEVPKQSPKKDEAFRRVERYTLDGKSMGSNLGPEASFSADGEMYATSAFEAGTENVGIFTKKGRLLKKFDNQSGVIDEATWSPSTNDLLLLHAYGKDQRESILLFDPERGRILRNIENAWDYGWISGTEFFYQTGSEVCREKVTH